MQAEHVGIGFAFSFIVISFFCYPLDVPKASCQSFEVVFADIYLNFFHSLNTSVRFNFFLICKGRIAMSGHRRVLSRLLSIRISCKIPIGAAVSVI